MHIVWLRLFDWNILRIAADVKSNFSEWSDNVRSIAFFSAN